jgi:hypothetical protein
MTDEALIEHGRFHLAIVFRSIGGMLDETGLPVLENTEV